MYRGKRLENGESFLTLDYKKGSSRGYCVNTVLFTVVIVSCLLYAEKVILGLEVVFTGDPFMVQENVGVGLPLALHKNDTFKPSSTMWFCGCSEISSWSVLGNKALICEQIYLSWSWRNEIRKAKGNGLFAYTDVWKENDYYVFWPTDISL